METHLRSFVKGVSWRVVGTMDTIIISYFVTGTITKALGIGLTEVITKILLFYVHERFWQVFGGKMPEGRKKAVFKAISWRITGTLDTIFLSFIIISLGSDTANEQPAMVQATTIGAIELATKITLFYLHERAWARVKWGKKQEEPSKHLGHHKDTTAHKDELVS